MKSDKLSVDRHMRMILHPLFRTVAVLVMIVFACTPFSATMAHADNAPHHAPVQTVGHGPVMATASRMTMHSGKATPCCPATGGQTDNSGCSAVACSSLAGAILATFATERPSRAMRDFFFTVQDKLSPHNLAPEPGPPRI